MFCRENSTSNKKKKKQTNDNFVRIWSFYAAKGIYFLNLG